REFGPAFAAETPYEEFGVEDPRITMIDGRFWITYVAVSRHGAASALASTDDFRSFVRHGVVFCPENKDVVLFPQRMSESYVALHRPSGSASFCPPEIWLARSPDLAHWGGHQVLCGGEEPWEGARVGAGPPPFALPEGWLVIYHGVGTNSKTTEVGTYSMGAMLLDREDPTRVLGRSREPILIPTAGFERRGFVDDITFPTGVYDRGDIVEVYYGASDKFIGVVEFAKADVLAAIT
ncbi:MAG: hypothetical protein KDA61_15250, partial [Planctomycetales bacterium]|nr:hypothetical protein [Planctomycetales bacterium]